MSQLCAVTQMKEGHKANSYCFKDTEKGHFFFPNEGEGQPFVLTRLT